MSGAGGKGGVAVKQSSRSTLKDFKILSEIGRGSYGVVYKVLRKQDNKQYVIKQIVISNLSRREQEDAIKEVNILASLNSPYVVKYYDSFIDDNKLNIVMELAEHGSLHDKLKNLRGRKLPENTIWSYLIQIALGMHHIHSRKILHRDMKSLNVFLDANDKVKIGDFGVAKILTNTKSLAQTLVGTPYYLSPELCENKPYGEKSDVWALGCILYELCTLKHPFDANNQGALILKIIRGKYAPISNQYSPELHEILKRLLNRDTHERPDIYELLGSAIIRSKAKALNIEMPSIFLPPPAAEKIKIAQQKSAQVHVGPPLRPVIPREPAIAGIRTRRNPRAALLAQQQQHAQAQVRRPLRPPPNKKLDGGLHHAAQPALKKEAPMRPVAPLFETPPQRNHQMPIRLISNNNPSAVMKKPSQQPNRPSVRDLQKKQSQSKQNQRLAQEIDEVLNLPNTIKPAKPRSSYEGNAVFNINNDIRRPSPVMNTPPEQPPQPQVVVSVTTDCITTDGSNSDNNNNNSSSSSDSNNNNKRTIVRQTPVEVQVDEITEIQEAVEEEPEESVSWRVVPSQDNNSQADDNNYNDNDNNNNQSNSSSNSSNNGEEVHYIPYESDELEDIQRLAQESADIINGINNSEEYQEEEFQEYEGGGDSEGEDQYEVSEGMVDGLHVNDTDGDGGDDDTNNNNTTTTSTKQEGPSAKINRALDKIDELRRQRDAIEQKCIKEVSKEAFVQLYEFFKKASEADDADDEEDEEEDEDEGEEEEEDPELEDKRMKQQMARAEEINQFVLGLVPIDKASVVQDIYNILGVEALIAQHEESVANLMMQQQQQQQQQQPM